MKKNKLQISVIGAGAFGTAFSTILAKDANNKVSLYSRSEEQAALMSKTRRNSKYLPGFKLNKRLRFSSNTEDFMSSDLLFIALPSSQINDFINKNINIFRTSKMVINLSKGFDKCGTKLITDHLTDILGHETDIATLKGPTFSMDLLLSPRSAFTIAGSGDIEHIRKVLHKSKISTDFSESIAHVEYMSIFKNIYAIIIGLVEARYQNANLRSFLFTKSLVEIKEIIEILSKDKEADVLKFCGLGDLLLTSLNDQSRNRTLGLMMGKQFITVESSIDGVVVEGFRSIKNVAGMLEPEQIEKFLLFKSLLHLVDGNYSIEEFVANITKP